MLIEIVLVLFLVLTGLVATVAVKVGFRAVDFISEARLALERLGRRQEEILEILASPPAEKKRPGEEG